MLNKLLSFMKKPSVLWPIAIYWGINAVISITLLLRSLLTPEIEDINNIGSTWTDQIILSVVVNIINAILFFILIAVAASVGNAFSSYPNIKKYSFKELCLGIEKNYEKTMLVFFLILGMFLIYSWISDLVLSFLSNQLGNFIDKLDSIVFTEKYSAFDIMNYAITAIAACFVFPFFALWIPAVTSGGNKISEGFKKSICLGRKYYGRIVAAMSLYCSPFILYFAVLIIYRIIAGNQSFISEAAYIIFLLLEKLFELSGTVILTFVMLFLFILYGESSANVEPAQEKE